MGRSNKGNDDQRVDATGLRNVCEFKHFVRIGPPNPCKHFDASCDMVDGKLDDLAFDGEREGIEFAYAAE